MATHENTRLTRRAAMVAGLVAVAVPAVPALANGADDAGLIELGRRWEALYREVLAFRPTADASWEKFEEAFEPILAGRPWSILSDSEAQALFAEHTRLRMEMGADADQVKLEGVYQPLDHLTGTILRTPAHTLRGVAVKARAAMAYTEELWVGPASDLDLDKHFLRDLIETICTMAGVPSSPVAA